MVEYIGSSKMIQYLHEARVIFLEGYGKGIPVYNENGLNLIENFIDLFRNSVKEKNGVTKELRGNKLVKKEDFFKMYRGINDYTDEIIEFKNYFVMSDALLDAIKYLLDNYNNNISVLTTSSIYRDKADKLVPLYKDKNIFPVIQIDQLANKEIYNNNINDLKKFYCNFFKKIGVNIAFLETNEVPNYANYELYFLTYDKESFTKVGMIYSLSDRFKENLSINSDYELIDSGISGKALYKSLENSSLNSKSFLIHPSIAYTDLMVAHSNKENYLDVINTLYNNKIRYNELSNTKKAYKIWRKSGIQHYLLVHNTLTLFSKNIDGEIIECRFDDIETLLSQVQKEKNLLCKKILDKSDQILNQAKNRYTEEICSECYKKEFYGYYMDNNAYKCKYCGKIMDKIILKINPKKRFY